MPDTGAPWNIPYVETTDLVSDWPADSLALANAIDAGLDAALVAGIGTNVVQTVKTDTFSTTSVSFTPVTGLTATITPTSATSKVLVIVQLSAGTTGAGFAQLTGGNSSGYVGDSDSSNRVEATIQLPSVPADSVSASIVYLDSPATTSAVTYGVDVRRGGVSTYTVGINRTGDDTDSTNRGRLASSITAIEVAV